MPFLTGWFRKNREEDYETVLSSLARDIEKRKTKLSELRLRERRSTLLTTLYALALWGAYVSLWYINAIPNFSGHRRGSPVRKAVAGAPVVVGPIIILFIRRIVQIWYKSKGDTEEKTLQILLKQQRNKVEDIKKKTNYYSTRNLIERYDDSSPSPFQPRAVASQLQTLPPITPQRVPLKQDPNFQTPSVPGGLKAHTPRKSPTSVQPQPLPIPRKQWYDKLVDAILGDDDERPTDAATRYALICENCFTHNGLVKESLWEDAQYICLKCGHFNVSARARKQGVSSPLPSSLFSLPLSTSSPATRPPRSSSSPSSVASDQPSSSLDRVRDGLGNEMGLGEHEAIEGNNSMHMDIDT